MNYNKYQWHIVELPLQGFAVRKRTRFGRWIYSSADNTGYTWGVEHLYEFCTVDKLSQAAKLLVKLNGTQAPVVLSDKELIELAQSND